jgi:hypothetical protein
MKPFTSYNDLYERVAQQYGAYSKEDLRTIILELIFNHEHGNDEDDTIHEINESMKGVKSLSYLKRPSTKS